MQNHFIIGLHILANTFFNVLKSLAFLVTSDFLRKRKYVFHTQF